jgi:hypothetical protein
LASSQAIPGGEDDYAVGEIEILESEEPRDSGYSLEIHQRTCANFFVDMSI